MKYKIIAISIFLSILTPLFFAQGKIGFGFVVNDELKQCRTYQPTSKTVLPKKWHYYDYQSHYKTMPTNDAATHKIECDKLGYNYIEGIMRGKISPSHLVYLIVLNSVLIISISLSIILYLKTKKKKILIAIPVLILLYFIIHLVMNFNIA